MLNETRAAARMPRLLVVTAIVAFFLLVSDSASAAIFAADKRWPVAADGSGLTVIPVCIADDSDVTEKAGGIYALFLYDPNPTLAQVVSHVRAAVESSWESVSGVRFVDWRMCSALDAADLSGAIQVYINPDAANASSIGTDTRGATHGVNFKPWGSSTTANLCITYDAATLHMRYDFSCVEQYSIHEFGHALGFLHEWYNPATPASCTQTKQSVQPSDWGPPLAGYSATCLGGSASCITVNPYSYDDLSIMTYDTGCADVHGVRFGSPTLDHWDALGAWVAYPLAAPGDTLSPGYGLLPGGAIHSPDGQFSAHAPGRPREIWSSMTPEAPPAGRPARGALRPTMRSCRRTGISSFMGAGSRAGRRARARPGRASSCRTTAT